MITTNKAIAISKKRRTTVSKKSLAAIETGSVQDVIDSLSERQRLFCVEYLVDLNGSAAVLRAGYNTRYPDRIAFQLRENPAIRVAIDALRVERGMTTDITKDYVLKKLVKTVEKAEEDNNHNATLRGLELLAKHLGMFIERQEISGPDGEAIKYEKIQEDAADLESAIASLVKRNGTTGLAAVPDSGTKS